MGGAAGDLDACYFPFAGTGAGLAGLAVDPQMFLEAPHIAPEIKVIGIGSAAIPYPFFEDFFDGGVERSGLGRF